MYACTENKQLKYRMKKLAKSLKDFWGKILVGHVNTNQQFYMSGLIYIIFMRMQMTMISQPWKQVMSDIKQGSYWLFCIVRFHSVERTIECRTFLHWELTSYQQPGAFGDFTNFNSGWRKTTGLHLVRTTNRLQASWTTFSHMWNFVSGGIQIHSGQI